MSNTPSPHIKHCGCWLWCDKCAGDGVIEVKSGWKNVTQECDECNGRPKKIKHCQECAIQAGWKS